MPGFYLISILGQFSSRNGQGTSTEDVNTDRGLPLSKQNP